MNWEGRTPYPPLPR